MDNAAATNLGKIPLAPRTPSAPARALIFATQARHLVFMILGLVFFSVGSILAVALNWRVPADLAIALGGQEATGHVIGAQRDLHVTVNGRHPMRLAFTYEAGGTQHTGVSSTIDPAIVAMAHPGADVPIEIAARHPDWARVRGTTVSIMGPWGALFLIMPALGLSLLAIAVRARRRRIQAFVNGQPIVARVVFAGADTMTRINGRNPLVVRWEFMLEGRTFKGSISSLKGPLIEPLMKQTELVVLYAPDDPKNNTCWIE
jgi:hypothetical protein